MVDLYLYCKYMVLVCMVKLTRDNINCTLSALVVQHNPTIESACWTLIKGLPLIRHCLKVPTGLIDVAHFAGQT